MNRIGLKLFLFDLDGTLALGDPSGNGLAPLPGAVALLEKMTAARTIDTRHAQDDRANERSQ